MINNKYWLFFFCSNWIKLLEKCLKLEKETDNGYSYFSLVVVRHALRPTTEHIHHFGNGTLRRFTDLSDATFVGRIVPSSCWYVIRKWRGAWTSGWSHASSDYRWPHEWILKRRKQAHLANSIRVCLRVLSENTFLGCLCRNTAVFFFQDWGYLETYVYCVLDSAHDSGPLDGASGVRFGSRTQRFEDGTSSSSSTAAAAAATAFLTATGWCAQIIGTRFPTSTIFYK